MTNDQTKKTWTHKRRLPTSIFHHISHFTLHTSHFTLHNMKARGTPPRSHGQSRIQPAPRRRGGHGFTARMTVRELAAYFHHPMQEAAVAMGVSDTLLKRVCRGLGIKRWPYRFLHRLSQQARKAFAEGSASESRVLDARRQAIIRGIVHGSANGVLAIGAGDADGDGFDSPPRHRQTPIVWPTPPPSSYVPVSSSVPVPVSSSVPVPVSSSVPVPVSSSVRVPVSSSVRVPVSSSVPVDVSSSVPVDVSSSVPVEVAPVTPTAMRKGTISPLRCAETNPMATPPVCLSFASDDEW
jgi:hypothetical protein